MYDNAEKKYHIVFCSNINSIYSFSLSVLLQFKFNRTNFLKIRFHVFIFMFEILLVSIIKQTSDALNTIDSNSNNGSCSSMNGQSQWKKNWLWIASKTSSYTFQSNSANVHNVEYWNWIHALHFVFYCVVRTERNWQNRQYIHHYNHSQL